MRAHAERISDQRLAVGRIHDFSQRSVDKFARIDCPLSGCLQTTLDDNGVVFCRL